MHYIQDGARSLSLLVRLNVDRLLFLGVLILALAIGGLIGAP